MYNQTVYGSIGYATGAALGAFKALREGEKTENPRLRNRCILVTGEGSLHLTVQAFADFLKLGLNPIVFVLNNDGYTVERLIHGRDAAYNKLPDVRAPNPFIHTEQNETGELTLLYHSGTTRSSRQLSDPLARPSTTGRSPLRKHSMPC